MVARNNIKFFLKSIKCNVLSALEYKKSFITQVIFMFVNNGFFLVFWNVVFQVNQGNVNGLVMKDILLLWSIPTISFGITNFFFDGIRQLNTYIITGTLDTYLLQPKNLFLNIATSKCDFGGFGDLLYGLVIGVIASQNLGEFGMILLFAIMGSIFFMATNVIVRCLAIWLGDVEDIARTYEQNLLINFSTYPEKIFSGGIKFLLYTVIPAAYIVHLPIQIMKNFSITSIALIVVVLVIYIILAKCLFSYSIKKYESGNSMTLKM